ncbi:hypothetical protein Patl1_26696 [Pistacia atlantica]|uniref:Uncharacterized protein n=1 Tax=Pistacia atlantica TaxID=434234 RepID=A0ACC1AZA8_9ROSI|nr:hypothetical protein Patl1_26696 [Pistacia atlantica]
MMSCVQRTGFCKPGVILPNRAQLKSVPCTTRRALVKLNATTSCPLFVPKLKGRQKRGVMCVLGGKDKSEDESVLRVSYVVFIPGWGSWVLLSRLLYAKPESIHSVILILELW